MLPARSKRYASVDGDIPREQLTGSWQLALLVLVVFVLFYLVFPKKALLQHLYDLEVLDDLSLSYVQNIRRADTRNADVALLMARHQAQEMDPADLEHLVRPFLVDADPRQQAMARKLLLTAYQRQAVYAVAPSTRARLRTRVAEAITRFQDEPLQEAQAHAYAKLAYQLGLMDQGDRLLARFASALTAAELEQLGYEALGRQEYPLASHYFMLAYERSVALVAMRRYYQLGVGAYMAGGLPREALATAERRLGRLRGDLPTVRYLVKLALAAGDPALAAQYARQLVFVIPSRGGSQ
jgi:hypothetical protein